MLVLSLILSLLFSVSAAQGAIEDSESGFSKKWSVSVGMGSSSSYGLIGLGIQRFVQENIAMNLFTGVDFGGSSFGSGLRYYSSPRDENMFFIIPSSARYFVGATVGQTFGGAVTSEYGNGQKGEYRFTPGVYSTVSVGTQNMVDDWFIISVELGYRYYLRNPAVRHESGIFSQDSINSLDQRSRNSFLFSVAAGIAI